MLLKLFDKFKRGDIVFGLAKPRDEVITELQKKGHTQTFANALNDPAVSLVLNKTIHRDAKRQLNTRQYKHYCFLRKNSKYLQRKPGRPLPLMQDRHEMGAAYRRACKLLLTSRDPKRTYNAHVVIKDIDLGRVCDKTKSGLGVTDSEIRAAYEMN